MTCCVLERGIIAVITVEGNIVALMLGEDALTLVLGEEELTLMLVAAKTKGSIFVKKTEDRS